MMDKHQHILNAARALFAPETVIEIRMLDLSGRVMSGYFDDLETMALTVAHYDEMAITSGIYWTLNPVLPDLLHRSKNRMSESQGKRGGATSDKEILKRALLLIDIDGATRPAGISATDEEVRLAIIKARDVARFLAYIHEWDEPWWGMSGNGCHLLYKIDEPNTPEMTEYIKKCLEALASHFDDEHTHIDTSVFNPSRISKVYGTTVRKGDNTAERPHRVAEFFGRMTDKLTSWER